MKKFLTITLLVLSMMVFVACGDSGDENDTGDTVNNSDSDTGDSATDEGNTDTDSATDEENTGTGSATDEENSTPDLPDDEEATDTEEQTNDEDGTGTGDNNEVTDDGSCETIVYKSTDVRNTDVNEIDIWFYDSETYEDDTPPLFFIEAYFTKNVTELKGETISLQDLDPNAENGTRVFFYTDFDASMWWFKKNYIAKSGSFHIEDIDANDYTKLKINTTAVLFYELAIDEENGIYNEVENGKCYKLEPLEWNSID